MWGNTSLGYGCAMDKVDDEEIFYLPEAWEVVAALPLLDVGGGDVVDQVFLLRELSTTVAPLAGKHTSALGKCLFGSFF